MRSGLSSVFKFKASQCLLLSKAPSNTRPKLGVEQGQELQAATGVPQPGVSHPLCSQGDQASSAQHKADTPAFQGAQCPHMQQPVDFLPLLHPQVQKVWDDLPGAASGARRVFGSSLGKFFPPKGSMEIVGGSSAAFTEVRPAQVVSYPQGSLWNVRKGTWAAREGWSAKQPLCPALAAGSELSTCHAGIVTLFPYNRAHMLQLPARLSQAHFPKLDT